MTRIAHLSDLHLLEDEPHQGRSGLASFRLRYLSFGRPLDAEVRRRRFARGLERARWAGADHVVVTGDLTEDGEAEQFTAVAEVLHESAWDPSQVTLLPGNHDQYTRFDAFETALSGPLSAFRETSTLGAPVALDDVMILPVCMRIDQPFTRSAGAMGDETLELVDTLAERTERGPRALLVAQHHPVHPEPLGMNWIDGTLDTGDVQSVLGRHEHVHVLHGHTHRRQDRHLGKSPHPRVFSPTSVVQDSAPLRLYDVEDRTLVPVELASSGSGDSVGNSVGLPLLHVSRAPH
jgi:3',5'-cyclic AMP phosphodiesterase CpdA